MIKMRRIPYYCIYNHPRIIKFDIQYYKVQFFKSYHL